MGPEKTFIIGDIHGCLSMLKNLLDKIDWVPDTDRLIFLGDYIDRGENPKGVVDYILSLVESSCNIDLLLGNHEVMLMDYLEGKGRDMYLLNGGITTVASYRAGRLEDQEPLVSREHMSFYRALRPYIELEDYYVVHAGFRPGIPVKDQSHEDMLWIRDRFVYSDYDFGKKVIFGHTPFPEPLVQGNKIGIDTGAVYGNRLTCLELPEFRFHFVEA